MNDAVVTPGRAGTRAAIAAAGLSLLPGAAGAAPVFGGDAGLAWPLLVAGLALGLAVAGVLLARGRARLRRIEAALEVQADVARAAERRARTDPATGLLNRRGLSAAFERHRSRLEDRDLVITVLMFAVDGLERIRAADGPEGAEAMLARLARVLPAVLRTEDDAGRVEGGRFAALVSAPRYATGPEGLPRRMQEAVAAAPELACLGEPMSLSVGIAQTAVTVSRFGHVLAEAELALDAAQSEGGGGVVTFGPLVAGAQARRSAALHSVAEAFSGDGPTVLYQPIVALGERRICAVAASPRLEPPRGAGTDAAALSRAAAEPRFALRLARHVQARAIAEFGQLRRRGVDDVQLALTAPEPQLADPGFAETLLDQLIVEGLSARDLWIGVPEGALLSQRLARMLETLERLAAAGAECGIDGFGTGHAPLAQLRRQPLSWIRLDPALAGEIAADEPAREIAAAARAMAAALGGRVCADGVDTAPVAAAAAGLGFDFAQGAHFCPAVPLAELEDVVRRGVAA